MTELRDYDKQCRGKRTYASKKDAKRAIKQSVTKYGAKRYSLVHPYKCPHCHWWHFGHRPRRSA